MSVIIAVKKNNSFVVGADKQASTDMTKDHSNVKVWKTIGGGVMGSVGSARASQVIQYLDELSPSIPIDIDKVDTGYVVNTLTSILLKALEGSNFSTKSEEFGCPIIPNEFIFALRDKCWVIWEDLSVTQVDDSVAIGSGADIANGVLYATRTNSSVSAEQRIKLCVSAAAETNLYVDSKLDLLETE